MSRFGHDFEAGDDGGGHGPWGVHGFEEDAIDAVADDEAFFVGFDVDIGGALFDGVEDEEIDKADDGAFAGGLGEVGDFLLFLLDDFEFLLAHVLDDFVELFAFGAGGVAGLDGGINVGLADDGDADGLAGDAAFEPLRGGRCRRGRPCRG